MKENKKCPFLCGKIDRYDGCGICCNGHNERYETEYDRDAWYAMRCGSDGYVRCDTYLQELTSQNKRIVEV